MTIKHLITLTVSYADYEADEYGRPACEPRDLYIPLIRVVKVLRDCRLSVAREAVNELGLKGATGCITVTLAASDAGLGRIYLLQRETFVRTLDWIEGRSKRAPSTFTIDSVESFRETFIHEEGNV